MSYDLSSIKGAAPGSFGYGVPKQDRDEEPAEDGRECPDCGGEGEIDLSLRAPRVVDCERCEGTGEIPA